MKLKNYLTEAKNTEFDIDDKFIDINSNNTKEKFTVKKTDAKGVYDEKGWYRLNKNCKKVKS